jgi:hypothetical protein
MKLSNQETKLRDRLIELGREATLDDLASAIWPAKLAVDWRSELAAKMRLLCAKTQTADIRVVRTTGLGRGNKALYRAIKKGEK